MTGAYDLKAYAATSTLPSYNTARSKTSSSAKYSASVGNFRESLNQAAGLTRASSNSPLLLLAKAASLTAARTTSATSATATTDAAVTASSQTGPRLISTPAYTYVHYGSYYDAKIHGKVSDPTRIDDTDPGTDADADGVTSVDGVKNNIVEPPGGFDYQLTEVGRIDRAPMAMFEHNGELLISAVTRNGISETPIWSYSEETGIQKRGALPEDAESGHAGYSYGSGFHLTPESWSGMKDYTASSADGPFTEHDYTYLNPHEYKNLKWGFSYQCPETGRQFMGFGNGGHPGVVLSYDESIGDWTTFSADPELRFPIAMGVITDGPNDGVALVSSNTYGSNRLHAVYPDGRSEQIKGFDDWGTMAIDHGQRVVYASLEQSGKVYWAPFDNLDSWQECKYVKPSGQVDSIEGMGEGKIHPQTGKMIFPAADLDAGNTAFYEANYENGEMVLNEVAYLGGVGKWAGKLAVVGDELYFGSGVAQGGKEADAVPGAIYRVDVS